MKGAQHMSRVGKSSPEAIALVKKEARAVELRAAGLTLQEITDRLGYQTASAAWKAIARGLARLPAPEVEAYRQIQALTLDLLQASIMAKALDANARGQLLAVDRVIAILERRARLFGLDRAVPTRAEISGKDAGPLEFTIVVPQGRDVESARRFLAEQAASTRDEQEEAA
jgi:hypothetical protein